MRTFFATLLLCLLTVWSIKAQNPQLYSVYFEHDQSALTVEAQAVLDQLTADLQQVFDFSIQLNAYTDNSGTEAYNLQLAKARAAAVEAYFAKNGMAVEKISMTSWGESRQFFENETEEGRRKNRRVDMAVQVIHLDNPALVFERLLRNKNQSFPINPAEEATVETNAGTIVVIPPNSLVFEDGTAPTGEVTFIVREALNPGDWLANNLSTVSNGQLLQTGGMIYIGAESEGRALKVASGANLTVAIPSKNQVDPDMELFLLDDAQGHKSDNKAPTNWQRPAERVSFRQTLEKEEKLPFAVDAHLAKRLASLTVPLPNKPVKPHLNIQPAPQPPKAPVKMRTHATKPSWETYAKRYDNRRGKLNDRKMAEAKAAYQRDMEKYQIDSTVCAENQRKYTLAFAEYQEQLKAYQLALAAWEADAKGQIPEFEQFVDDLFVYHYGLALERLLKGLPDRKKELRYQELEFAISQKAKSSAAYFTVADPDYVQSTRELKSYYAANPSKDEISKTALVSLSSYRLDEENCVQNPSCTFKKMKELHEKCGLTALCDSIKTVNLQFLVLNGNKFQRKQALQAYIAEVGQLGWINVDKFSKNTAPRTELAFQVDEDVFAMYAYIPELNSMLCLSRQPGGKFGVAGVPKGIQMELFTLKIGEGKLWVSRERMRVGQASPPRFDRFKACPMSSFRQELASL